MLAQHLYQSPQTYAEGWNFGPNDEDAKPVDWILNRMVDKWPGASWQLDTNAHPHEAGYLKLDVSKAKNKLNWQSVWNLEKTLKKILAWHKAWLKGEDTRNACIKEVNAYMEDMKKQEMSREQV